MKRTLLPLVASTSLLLGLAAQVRADAPAAGYLDFGKLTASAEGGQFVEVNVPANLLRMAAQITRKQEPELASLLDGLSHVRVNVVGLGNDNRSDITGRLTSLRQTLDQGGWQRIVTAQEKNEDVSVYLKTRSTDTIEGLVVTVLSKDREAVLVNIVGNIQVEQIARLGEGLNIAPLRQIGEALGTNRKPAEAPAK